MARTSPCPFLTADRETACCADSAVYRPSAFERDEYCSSVRYAICPLYCASTGGQCPAATGAALSRRELA